MLSDTVFRIDDRTLSGRHVLGTELGLHPEIRNAANRN
jgi:hypothetical protein